MRSIAKMLSVEQKFENVDQTDYESYEILQIKRDLRTGRWWLMPIILATLEAEIRSQPQANSS
jgi:hypothetical protein